ncbi:mitochondrial ribosomal protein L37-domain-containing protein [Suillus lakei]|nr:mitochondrial ribosomal protein L37-domain-containing protein [Suillus lakei]
MSLLAVLYRSSVRQAFSPFLARGYAAKSLNTEQKQNLGAKDASVAEGDLAKLETTTLSSCPPGTVLEGLNYLKGQPPVIALPDDEYPSWLWDLLKSKSKAEKKRLRRENQQRIKDQNFMKTQ